MVPKPSAMPLPVPTTAISNVASDTPARGAGRNCRIKPGKASAAAISGKFARIYIPTSRLKNPTGGASAAASRQPRLAAWLLLPIITA